MAADKPEHVDPDKAMLIYTTFPSLDAAEAVANELVGRRLVACANIIPGMLAIYSWQGKLHRDQEVVMVLKTRRGLCDAVIAATKALHPFDNPAIVALEVVAGSDDYLRWIATQTMPADVAGQSRLNSNDASP